MRNDWESLLAKLILVLQGARAYLYAREEKATEVEEKFRTCDLESEVSLWIQNVESIRSCYSSCELSTTVSDQDHKTIERLFNDLQLVADQLQNLHEYYDFARVDQAFTKLSQFVQEFSSAGPHGSGGGRPGK